MKALQAIRIVLVEPQHPGNIGAAARAMKAMGLAELALVKPRHFPHAEATARAAGADDVLAQARLFDTLDAAVANCSMVVGTSARQRALSWPLVEPRAAAGQLITAAGKAPAALVFGRERSGLTNTELDLCQAHLRIPTNPDFASLNLAAAVQLLCYELLLAARDETMPSEQAAQQQAASAAQVEGFYGHLEAVMVAAGFLDPEQPKYLMRRMRRLFNRARLEQPEIHMLRGLLKALDPRR